MLADTSFVVGLIEQRDVHHAVAVAIADDTAESESGPIVIGDAVVLESLQVMERRYGMRVATAATALLGVGEMEMFLMSSHAAEALRAVARCSALGFVDALTLARSRATDAEVLTFDRALQRTLSSGTP